MPDAVGHRVVHGGTRFTGPARVDDVVRAALEELTDLAPLHQPKSLAALDAVTAVLSTVPAVACFDTAEHEHLSPHEVAAALEQRSGLTAPAGTGDMREVEAAAERDDPDAVLALEVYTHRLVGGIAAMAAVAGGPRTVVVAAREDLQIAAETRQLLAP